MRATDTQGGKCDCRIIEEGPIRFLFLRQSREVAAQRMRLARGRRYFIYPQELKGLAETARRREERRANQAATAGTDRAT